MATLPPMSPATPTPAKPKSNSSPAVSAAEGVMQGPMEEQGSGGSTITCEIEGAGSGREGGWEGREKREGKQGGEEGGQERKSRKGGSKGGKRGEREILIIWSCLDQIKHHAHGVFLLA